MNVDSPEFLENPYKFYDERRELAGPIFKRDAISWTLTGYDVLSRVLAHPAAGRGNIGQTPRPLDDQSELKTLQAENSALRILEQWMLFKNPPEHTNARSRIADIFTIKMVERLEELMRVTARQLIADIKRNNVERSFDLVTELAYPYPTEVICHMIGIPERDRPQFEQWTKDLSLAVQVDFHTLDEQRRTQLNATADQLSAYFERLIDDKKRSPGNDLMSRFMEEYATDFSHLELLSNCVFMLFAGQETTASQIGNGLYALLSNPEQLTKLRQKPSLMSNAVEEFLRFDPPIQMVGRLALKDIHIDEHTILAGEHIFAFLGAAGRDPQANIDPHHFDVERKNIKHLAFVRGTHHCLGASLAKKEIRVFLEEILDAFPHLALLPGSTLRNTWLMRGYDHLPVSFANPVTDKSCATVKTINLPSLLFPFRLRDLASFSHKGCLFENVYLKITDQQQSESVDLWKRNRVISDDAAAMARSNEVCYLIREASSQRLVGVNTLYKDRSPIDGETVYFNRMFIEFKHRHLSLSTTGTALMLCFVHTQISNEGIRGIININENRKLSGPGLQRLFSRLGYQPIGWQEGKEIIFFEFSKITFKELDQ